MFSTLDSISVSAIAKSLANAGISENVTLSPAPMVGVTSPSNRRGEPDADTSGAICCFMDVSREEGLRRTSKEYDVCDVLGIGDSCLDLGGEILLFALATPADEGPAPLSAAAGVSGDLRLGGGGVLDGSDVTDFPDLWALA
jgi:hypothetical protein